MQNSSDNPRNVLLLEPDYRNKYPPVALMKLATYHRRQGWNIVFWKGDFRRFVAERLALRWIAELPAEVRWGKFFPLFTDCIMRKKSDALSRLSEHFPEHSFTLLTSAMRWRRAFERDEYFTLCEWDRILVTTLFTFYADITVETIRFAQSLRPKEIMVGGVMASVVPEYIEEKTGIKPTVGLLSQPAIFDDTPLSCNIDDLPLDHSILEEIEWTYPSADAHFAHTTRGCPNKCPFCAVPLLEPTYQSRRRLSENIAFEREMFGPKPNLLLMDNNVFASHEFPDIIDEIKSLGFGANAKITPAEPLAICRKHLRDGWNVRAYLRKSVALLQEFALSAKLSEEDRSAFRALLLRYNAEEDWHGTTPAEVLSLVEDAEPILRKYLRPPSPRKALVDFNQGLDSRLSTKRGIMSKLSQIAIRPVRIAFDHWSLRAKYIKAVETAAKAGLSQMSNYILYNFNDTPQELYWRLRLNLALCEQLGVNIYSFPMKYHPIRDAQWFSNRNYLGKHWCRRYIRAVQTILNATKGKIGRGQAFFLKSFGRDTQEFLELLLSPNTFLLNRWEHELNGDMAAWRKELYKLSPEEIAIVRQALLIENTLPAKHSIPFLRFYEHEKKDPSNLHADKLNAAIHDFNQKYNNIPLDASEEWIKTEKTKCASWSFLL